MSLRAANRNGKNLDKAYTRDDTILAEMREKNDGREDTNEEREGNGELMRIRRIQALLSSKGFSAGRPLTRLKYYSE